MAERLIPERLKIRPEQLSASVPLEEIEQQPLGTRFAPSDKVAERTFLYPDEDVFDRKINEQPQEQMDKAMRRHLYMEAARAQSVDQDQALNALSRELGYEEAKPLQYNEFFSRLRNDKELQANPLAQKITALRS